MATARLAALFSLIAAAVIYAPSDAHAMSDIACKNAGGVVKWNGTHLKLCCQNGDKVLYCEQPESQRTLGKRKKPMTY